MFPSASFRSICVTLSVLGALWLMFLVSAHLFLDFEQSRVYLSRLTYSTPLFELVDNRNGGDSVVFQSICEIPVDRQFPDCENQVQRLRENWAKDPCYKDYDVDGTDCSIIVYLSEVESWCPRLPWRKHMKKKERKREQAILRDDLDELTHTLGKAQVLTQFVPAIQADWHHWKDGLRFMKHKSSTERYRKKVLVYIGMLDELTGNTTVPMTDELQQWLDLLTSLFILGHDLTVSRDRGELLSYLSEESSAMHRRCTREDSGFDLVYTDHAGLDQLMLAASQPETRARVMDKYRCRFRVLDSYGTDAEFNYAKYDKELPGGRSNMGNLQFHLRQLMTKFPSSPDNSFLGLKIGASLRKRPFHKKQKMLVIYGTKSSTLKGHDPMLEIIKKYLRIHTVFTEDDSEVASLPSYVINHGKLKPAAMDALFEKAKAVVGLGSPLEDMAPLRALSKGCVFINPKFDPPRDRLNTPELADKPSLRKLTSQQPYLEKFVAKPHAVTLDLGNSSQIEAAIKRIAKTKVRPIIPFEFTTEGLLERLNAYIINQDFCQNSQWPPATELRVKISFPGDSCIKTCSDSGLVCEPELFHAIESRRIHGCRIKELHELLVAPAKAFNSTVCMLQKQPLLYSCSASDASYRRVCPCRTRHPQQRALCANC